MATCLPLVHHITGLADPRGKRGRRYPLAAMLSLAVAATLCGAQGYCAMAEWGRSQGAELARSLGFTRARTPCAATFCLLLRRLDRQALEACLGQWVAQVLAALPPAKAGGPPGLAIDGKTLRGSRKQGAPLTHILSAVSHRLGLTLGQVAVDDKTNEITAIHTLLEGLLLAGQVVTLDALLTQRKIAQALVDAGADYIMVVKENQPALHEALATAFADPALLAAHPRSRARSLDRGHGRLERRVITLSSALADYLDWPGQQQAFQLVRSRTNRKTGAVQAETIYGLTSLSAAKADATYVLARVRNHWIIENGSHYVRDVTFHEDRSQVRAGSTPQVLAALRNVAIALHRLHGETNMASACRRTAAKPRRALKLLGIDLKKTK